MNYYLTGIDYSGIKWKFEISKEEYNKYFGGSFNGTVRLEVWENLNRIEEIISVEPNANKPQEIFDWNNFYNQQETVDLYNMIYNQNVTENEK